MRPILAAKKGGKHKRNTIPNVCLVRQGQIGDKVFKGQKERRTASLFHIKGHRESAELDRRVLAYGQRVPAKESGWKYLPPE